MEVKVNVGGRVDDDVSVIRYAVLHFSVIVTLQKFDIIYESSRSF